MKLTPEQQGRVCPEGETCVGSIASGSYTDDWTQPDGYFGTDLRFPVRFK